MVISQSYNAVVGPVTTAHATCMNPGYNALCALHVTGKIFPPWNCTMTRHSTIRCWSVTERYSGRCQTVIHVNNTFFQAPLRSGPVTVLVRYGVVGADL